MQNLIPLYKNKEMKSYLLGFLCSVVLTTVPFILAMQKIFSNEVNCIIFLLCAISQIIIHFVCFLHLNFSHEQRWNLITLLFVMVIIFIVVFGSIWIMCNLNHHII